MLNKSPLAGNEDGFSCVAVRQSCCPLLPRTGLFPHTYNTSQQDFVPRKVYRVFNIRFHAESKYATKIFPSPTVFVQWHILLLIFQNFS
jgi:hypothetical protein